MSIFEWVSSIFLEWVSSIFLLFLDEKLSGGASVLFNPLWALLEYDELSTAEAVKFASYLPFDLQKCVLSNDRRKIKADERTIYKLAQQGSFDTLAAMSIIYLHIKPTLYAYSRLVINKEFTLFIFSLFMTKFKRYDVGYFLIHKLSLLFNLKKIAPYDTYARFTLWDNNESKSFSMPITLSLITSAKMLNACCAVSGHIVNKTIKLLSLAPSNEMKHQVISHINLQNSDELTWNFYLIEKGEELSLDAELWKLRDRLNI